MEVCIMENLDFDFGEFNMDEGQIDPLETDAMPDARSVRRRTKNQMRLAMKTRELGEIMPVMEMGWTYHVITRGNFDGFNFLPLVVERHGPVEEYYFTTWALNRDNVVAMMGLYDEGKVGEIRAFIGTYLKRRKTAVYGLLQNSLHERGQKMKAFRNHTKIQLIRAGEMYVVVEGSANLTANGNCENFVVSCDREVYEFHKGWLNEMMEK